MFQTISLRCLEADRRANISLQERQKGLGSQAHDPAQSDIRKYFGGGVIDGMGATPEEDRAQGNPTGKTTDPRL